jgi:YegS/Rv2252/BmrU family lipid kinase
MKYLFIVNPISGPRKRAKQVVDYIAHQITKSDHTCNFVFTQSPGDATLKTKQAVSDGIDIVVAAGGDGTINEVATGLIHTKSILGVIPLGSGNGIARSLNIPIPLEKCVELLINPKIKILDVGKINDRFFFGVCGIGYDAEIGKKFQEFGVRGPIPYFMIGAKEYLFYQPHKFQLEFNGLKKEIRALFIACANTKQYGNGAIIAPQADPCDGVMDLCIVGKVSIVKAFYLAFKLFRGEIEKTKYYQHHTCQSVKITTALQSNIIHTDGEPIEMGKTLDIILIEKAINVCAPM